MKLLKLSLVVILLGLLFFSSKFYQVIPVRADDDPCQQQDQTSQCQNLIQQYQKQLDDARGQEKTLKSQLDIIDGQTKITTLKIEDTNQKIDKLKREITDLSGRIIRISGTLDSLSEVLLKRIVQTYKYSSITPIDLLFSSHGFSDLLERLKYIQVVQAYDKKKLYELQATKVAYNDQKQDRQTRQAEAEKLEKDLADYKSQLDSQKAAKAALLRATQNNEAVFQQKLQAALAEQAAILAIAGNAANEVQDGQVSKGQAIGNFINGPSPCSQGSHLHFEVHQNNSTQDPSNLLASVGFLYLGKYQNDNPDDSDGHEEGAINPHGSWDTWPIYGTPIITQGYGFTPFAKLGFYNGGPHTGIDMWSPGSTAVRAVHDGQLSHGGIACGKGTLLYKRVDHGDGYSSFYLHVI